PDDALMRSKKVIAMADPSCIGTEVPLPNLCRRLAGDDGMTLIWVALVMVVILLFAALAIDGGQAYQSGRQSQNGAASGAMAGARVLDNILYNAGTNYSQIPQQIRQLAQKSGSDTATGGVRCWIITFPDANGNTTRISPGTDTDGLDMCSTSYAP